MCFSFLREFIPLGLIQGFPPVALFTFYARWFFVVVTALYMLRNIPGLSLLGFNESLPTVRTTYPTATKLSGHRSLDLNSTAKSRRKPGESCTYGVFSFPLSPPLLSPPLPSSCGAEDWTGAFPSFSSALQLSTFLALTSYHLGFLSLSPLFCSFFSKLRLLDVITEGQWWGHSCR